MSPRLQIYFPNSGYKDNTTIIKQHWYLDKYYPLYLWQKNKDYKYDLFTIL